MNAGSPRLQRAFRRAQPWVVHYPDNNQPWAANAEAETWQDAIKARTKDVAEGWKVRVCGVVEGNHLCVDDLQETLEISNPVPDSN